LGQRLVGLRRQFPDGRRGPSLNLRSTTEVFTFYL
jgi:hypothetical protein